MDFERIAVVLRVWHDTLQTPTSFAEIHKAAEAELLEHIERAKAPAVEPAVEPAPEPAPEPTSTRRAV